MKSYYLLLFFLLSTTFHLFTEENPLPTPPPFGILTVHKSGTHLIMKCVELLQSRNSRLIRYDLELKDFNQFQFPNQSKYVKKLHDLLDETHYFNDHTQSAEIIKEFSEQHPEFPWILGIRDLRDAIISQAHYLWDNLEKILGPSTLKQKITFLLDINNTEARRTKNVPSIYFHAKAMVDLFSLPNSIIIRFEDLVGEEGGGNGIKQRAAIEMIAHHIGVGVTETELNHIQTILFGNETKVPSMRWDTFRSGQIGSWKEVFTKEHKKYFKTHYGDLHKAFGYSLN